MPGGVGLMSMVDVDCHPCPSDGTDQLARHGDGEQPEEGSACKYNI